jgi:predicted DNA-binding transcriptional regulator AlpA
MGQPKIPPRTWGDRPIASIGHNGGPPLDTLMSATVKTTVKLTGFSKDTVYDLIAAREFRSFLMGSRRYIDIGSVREYIARRAAEPLTIRRSPKIPTGPRSGVGARSHSAHARKDRI